MDNDKILQCYAERLGSTGANRNLYIKYARDFLDYALGNYDRQTLDRYLEHLRKNDYSDGTINFVFRILRTMYQRNKMDWPYRRGESPSIREDQVNAPAIHPDLVIDFIQAAKESDDDEIKFFLALSTTYGLRREEMVELSEEEININDRTIHISTVKHGRDRTHIIPAQIVPYLEGYNLKNRVSSFYLFSLWYRIENMIGITHTDGVGFHSIRRTLDTLLLDQLPDTVVMSFLRWKQKTSASMPYRYSAQTFVGRDGRTTKVIGDALDVDVKVFAIHPFIKYWEESNG